MEYCHLILSYPLLSYSVIILGEIQQTINDIHLGTRSVTTSDLNGFHNGTLSSYLIVSFL